MAGGRLHPDGRRRGLDEATSRKQRFYEPFLGGGILTALGVPLILGIGSLTFGIASAAATAGLIVWGVARTRPRAPRL